ncbi:hypothetical protein AB4Z21_11835 [Paenibacillus sp. MCAF20]
MTNTKRIDIVKPGFFATAAAADGRRGEFDIGNEIIIAHNVPVDFVFIGDSITHMWELNAYFGRGGQFVVNRGIGGDISSHVLRRFDVIKVNDMLQLVADEEAAVYVDYHSLMTQEDGARLREELADDGLHPHLLGYDIMAKSLIETLERKGILVAG